MRGPNHTLLSNAAAGNGAAFQWQGGKGTFIASATFATGSVKLQYMTIDNVWVDVDGTSLTAAGTKTFDLPIGPIRAVGTTASAIYAYAHPV